MKTSQPKRYAVLTGDIVDSSLLSAEERQALPALLRKLARTVRGILPKAPPADLDVFRGDSWQWLTEDAALSLRAALLFRAGVIASAEPERKRDTRIAIGIGPIDFVPSGRVTQGDGAAYRLSGQALDAMESPLRMKLALDREDARRYGTIVELLDAIVEGWTAFQARAAIGRLQGWTQAKIATLWPERISQPTVAKHLERAHWPVVERALLQFEADFREE